MNKPDCDRIRDFLSEWAGGSGPFEEWPEVEGHLRSCGECRSELEVIRAIRGAKPEVPTDLAARIQARVREEFEAKAAGAEDLGETRRGKVIPMWRDRRYTPMWALSAAAVVILALGTGILWNTRNPAVELDSVDVASLEPLPEAWLWDDAMVAGAPVFDGLSDEELEALLKEFEG